MDGYIRSFTLDVNAENNHQFIKAKQGDTVLRKLAISLLQDGIPYTPSGVSKYSFRCAKPDRTAVVLESDGGAVPIVATGGIITITLSQQCLAVAGRSLCDLALEDSSGNVISSADFVLDVIPMPDIGNIITSSTEWERLMRAIEEAESFSTVLQFRVSGGYIQYTTDGTTWKNLCLVSDIVEPMTTDFIDGLFS